LLGKQWNILASCDFPRGLRLLSVKDFHSNRHASGSMPVGDSAIRLQWSRDKDVIRYSLEVPDGLVVENKSSAKLEKR
jgi:hypothetical protein